MLAPSSCANSAWGQAQRMARAGERAISAGAIVLLRSCAKFAAFVQGSKTPCKNFTLTEQGKHPFINRLLHAAVFLSMTLDPRRIVLVVCLDVYLLDVRMASDLVLYMI
eukprot:6172396-Pleurochrysis_carterae.AAC.1